MFMETKLVNNVSVAQTKAFVKKVGHFIAATGNVQWSHVRVITFRYTTLTCSYNCVSG